MRYLPIIALLLSALSLGVSAALVYMHGLNLDLWQAQIEFNDAVLSSY